MPPRRLQQVDVKRIADLVVRRGGDAYEVARRFARAKSLTTLDKLRIQRMATQQAAIRKAIREQGK